AVLERLGRRHRANQLREACSWLRQAQQQALLQSWSLDLIVNLPQQSFEAWDWELSQALAQAPPHLSIYDLIVEPGTVFAWRQGRGELPLPDDDQAADRL
ncbi:MAG: radical SAM protein, partial [Prochlorococcaceae cyanobacterium]